MLGNCLHEIFEKKARQAPEQIAVSTLNEQISYGELNLRANKLAHKLQVLGVEADVLVGLFIDRSIEMIIGMLAILKSGGAYVPIDPNYPTKRIHLLLNDSAVSIVITASSLVQSLNDWNGTIICFDEIEDNLSLSFEQLTQSLLTTTNNPSNLAYVIYTSGSTGVPKGVMVEHRNVIRLFEQTHHWFHFDDQDVWTMFHSISFDFSVWEIWGALLYGGHLVIAPFEITRSPKEFYNLLINKRVTILNQTPSAFRQLVAADLANKESSNLALRCIIFGGEALNFKQLQAWIERHGDQSPKLINMYGITETTVHVTYKQITKEDLNNSHLNLIGIPIPDLEIHLLDTSGQSVPDNTPGEICIGGAGLVRGYLNRTELTDERFLEHHNINTKAKRLYYSGDYAVRLSNGELVYLGRSDEQIKLRGFRIELREVELCLLKDSQIVASIVMPRDYEDGDVRLVAHIVPNLNLDLTAQVAEDLKKNLAQIAAAELPVHMRPSLYIIHSELPLTSHGKIDKNALLAICEDQYIINNKISISLTFTEQKINKIWEDVLKIPNIGKDEHFFELGGTSLALIRVFGRINEQFQIYLDVSEAIKGATISYMASLVDRELLKAKS